MLEALGDAQVQLRVPRPFRRRSTPLSLLRPIGRCLPGNPNLADVYQVRDAIKRFRIVLAVFDALLRSAFRIGYWPVFRG
jgi:hypothetical protein